LYRGTALYVLILPYKRTEDAMAEIEGNPGFFKTMFLATLVLPSPFHTIVNRSVLQERHW
jgi:hypothetical protein